jgi:H+-transporting ATPase
VTPEEPGSLEASSGRATARELGVDPERGLDPTEVARRRERFGYNETAEARTPGVLRLLRRFGGSTSVMLELTVALALFLGNRFDAVVIGLLLVFNAVLGFLQEDHASRAVDALKERLRIRSRVLRAGAWSLVAARELVPGDVLRLRAGDFVPADSKVVSGAAEVDEAALTGESTAVSKAVDALLRSGSVLRHGEVEAIVIATGPRTTFGRTVQLVEIARPKLHAERVIGRVVAFLLAMVASLLLLAAGVAARRGIAPVELLPLLLLLLVSAIPVALPAMFTVTMAIGATELARRGALVTRLNATEDAAAADVLCIDKTGTLTANQLEVASISALPPYAADDVLRLGALASEEGNRDPIDLAFLRAARAKGLLDATYRRVSFVPFDPATRRTEARLRHGEEELVAMKGASRAVASACAGGDASGLEAAASAVAAEGLRVIGVARTEAGAWRPVGVAGLSDLPRPEARDLVAELRALGIGVTMLTGDALPIALQVARAVGLVGRVESAASWRGTAPGPRPSAGEPGEGFVGLAEVYPEDKYEIVRGLQQRGHRVAMTGDGVNDAPALRQAEVGIAVSNATDVAKAAASVVLTLEGLAAIPELVRAGRRVHERIRTWILNKLVKTFQTVVFVVVAFLLTGRFVVSTSGMVLLLFLVDFVTLSLATDRVRPRPAPTHWNVAHLTRLGVALGALCVVESLGALRVVEALVPGSTTGERLASVGFAILFYFGLCTVFVVRERGWLWSSRPGTLLLAAALADGLVGAVLCRVGLPGLAPIPLAAVAAVVGCALAGSLLNDAAKQALAPRGA